MFLRAQVRKCPENWWMNFLIILVQKPVWLLPRADCHTHKKVSRPSDISDTKVHHLLGFFRRWSRHGFSKPSAAATQLAEELKNWPKIQILYVCHYNPLLIWSHTHKKVSWPSDISDTKVHHLLGFFRCWSWHGFSKPSATATQLAKKLKNLPKIRIPYAHYYNPLLTWSRLKSLSTEWHFRHESASTPWVFLPLKSARL